MTEEVFLGMMTIVIILLICIIMVIWWIGTDIVHELRHHNFLLKEKEQNKDE
jgi:sorbitol-specific phosphotransferase system component IIC